MPTASSTRSTALKCPKCKEGGLRHSRRRRGDSLWRRLFFSAYRCRQCRARSWRFDGGRIAVVAITGAVMASLGTVIAIGIDDDPDLNASDASSPESAQIQAQTQAQTQTTAATPSDAKHGEAPTQLHLAAHPDLPQRAEQGDAKAQAALALAYLYGQGVAKDVRLARQWAEKASLQGHAEGQYVLGLISLAGLGVLQDFQAAIKWFEKAARQNHAEAQYRLGVIYQRGYGVAADKTKAHFWFNLAAAQGHLEATAARERLMPIMTAEQIDTAQREALAWRPLAVKP